jgi:hypothetical protein
MGFLELMLGRCTPLDPSMAITRNTDRGRMASMRAVVRCIVTGMAAATSSRVAGMTGTSSRMTGMTTATTERRRGQAHSRGKEQHEKLLIVHSDA